MTTPRRAKVARAAWAVCVLTAFSAGGWISSQPSADAQSRKVTPKEHFQAGSERSLPLLEEISATLKQIDGRLARIEKSVAEAAKE
jgi:hypothetical protein